MENSKKTAQKTKAKAKPQTKKNKLSNRAKWRRRGRIAVVVLPIVTVVMLLAVLLGATVFFKVDSYAVSGTDMYTAEQVWNASQIKMGSSMLTANVKKASESIEIALPYIEDVAIKRKLPGTLSITVKQSKAALGVEVDGQWMLLNSHAKVIDTVHPDDIPEGVMRLKLPQAKTCKMGYKLEFEVAEGEKSPIDICTDILTQIDKTDLKGKITECDVSDPDDVVLTYDSRIRMKIGRTDDLTDKLALAIGALKREDEIDPEQTGTLNLTVEQQAYFKPDSSANKNAADSAAE